MASSFTLIVMITIAFSGSIAVKYEDDNDSKFLKIKKGKEKLEEIEGVAEYSRCWKDALENLHSSCRSMSDDEQRRLALDFANCHFKSSNRGTYPCPREHSISDCTSREKMDDAAFQVYTEFFTHSSNICYFVQSLSWQEKTERTVNKLSHASEETVKKLQDSLEYHKKLETKQNIALTNQKSILEQDEKISKSLEKTKSNMDHAFQEMYAKAESQKLLLDDVLGTMRTSLGSIQWALSSILGELITLETAGFFVFAVVLITFLPQFGTSRLWLFVVLLSYGVSEGLSKRVFFMITDPSKPNAMASLHAYLWYSRWVAVVLLAIIYYWRYVSFASHEKAQEKLLKDMNKQLHYIKQSLPCTPRAANFTAIEEADTSFVAEETDSYPLSSGDEQAFVTPLKTLYSDENSRPGNIVSGTQLVDFLSGLYIKDNIQSDIEVYTTTDDTYRPPPSMISTITDTESILSDEGDISFSAATCSSDLTRNPLYQLTALTYHQQHHSSSPTAYSSHPLSFVQPPPLPQQQPSVPRASSNTSLISNHSNVSVVVQKCTNSKKPSSSFSAANATGNRISGGSATPTTVCNNSSTNNNNDNSQAVVRESTPLPVKQGKPKKPRKRRSGGGQPRWYSYNRSATEEDDSGFSTDGSSMRPSGRKYNLRPRKKRIPANW